MAVDLNLFADSLLALAVVFHKLSAEIVKIRTFFFQFTCSVLGSERTCSIIIVTYLNF